MDGAMFDIVIVGGGTAGWMTAAALVHHLGHRVRVRLIESADIGIVGVGEATLPHVRQFVQALGIDEAAFMAATDATYKLGIAFADFGAIGERYVHPFGTFGRPLAGVGFQHFWLRHAGRDGAVRGGDIGAFSLGVQMAEARRFAVPRDDDLSLAASYGYAYHFDATKFGPFLRDFAVPLGVTRTEATVVSVERDATGGDVAAVLLDTGERVTGDLFVDCSGFRSLLLGAAMGTAWEDWSRWLPCDRAVAVPCESPAEEIAPYTGATAMASGWRWRIPLTRRVGNGYVFSSAHCDEGAATAALLGAIEGAPLADPRVLRFRAGRRAHGWVGNVVGIGLASGFLEPLESTSIHLAQVAIERLIDLFPSDVIRDADRAEFNRLVDFEYDRVRDFLILHYHATRRDDSPFWNDMRTMPIPDSLAAKLELWRATGRVEQYGDGLFREPSWIAVYLGQGVIPRGYDPRADIPADAALARAMDALRGEIADMVAAMPGHRAALERAA